MVERTIYPMPPLPPPPRRPISLLIVAWIFIIIGVLSAFDIIWSAFFGRVSLNIGVFWFLIGWGLLRLSSVARIIAMVIISLQLIFFALLTVLVLLAGGNLYYSVNGQRRMITSSQGHAVAVAIALAFFLISLWELLALLRPSVRAVFLARKAARLPSP